VVRSKNITIKNTLPDVYIVGSGLAENDKILLEGVQNVKEDDKISYSYADPKKVISTLQLIK
jgi:membrane fusion protein (multidrug efflux system)